MRILITCFVYPPEVASAASMTRELAEDLAAHGHQVDVVTGFPNAPGGKLFPGWRRSLFRDEEGTGFRIRRVWHSLGFRKSLLHRLLYYSSFSVFSFLRALWGGPVEAIVNIGPPVVGPLAFFTLAQIKKAKFFYVNWDIYPEIAVDTGVIRPGIISKGIARLDTWMANRSAKVLVHARSLREVLVSRGVRSERVAILPIWTDSCANLDEMRPNAWREQNGIPQSAFIVLYAGTIGLLNNAEVLIRAAHELNDCPAVLVVFVGAGAAEERVKRLADGLGLRNSRFLGLQPKKMMPQIYAAADVCVLTLESGRGRTSAPSKILGYMEAGKPIIASVDADSPTSEWIRDAECGFVCRPDDPAGLAKAIRQLRHEPDLREAFGKNGRRYFEDHFSRKRCTPLYEEVIVNTNRNWAL